MQQAHLMSLALLLVCSTGSDAAGGSLSPESLCVYPGDEATFTCSVEGSGGRFAWITNATTETCQVFSSSPQSQCGHFIGQLLNSSLSTLTATSAATSDAGNILIQCYYITDLVGCGTLLIADPGIPPPTPILHDVTSEDIQDNGDNDTRIVTLRWTLSEPDDCLNTIHFNVTPDDPIHCGSCEVGPGDPGVQEEFSCQIMQGIGQSCIYRVYAGRCGDIQNGVPSEPVKVHVLGVVVEFDPSSYIVNEDDGFVTFTIVKRNETTPSITVNFSTVSDTAKGTLDYVPKNLAEVTFAPSETVKTVQVIIVNDNTTELQEMFSGRLTPVFPIVDIGQGEAVVVIVDDDMTSSSSHPPPVTPSSSHPPPMTSIPLQPTKKTPREGDGDSGSVAVIAGGVAGGVAVIVAIAAVVSGILCYCHFRGKKNKPTSEQPEAEYEEIPSEPQGAIEMKENTAYGPVTPRGGPVYEVPGGGQAANEGIETGRNLAYGHVHH